jgi:hypothetical protein
MDRLNSTACPSGTHAPFVASGPMPQREALLFENLVGAEAQFPSLPRSFSALGGMLRSGCIIEVAADEVID